LLSLARADRRGLLAGFGQGTSPTFFIGSDSLIDDGRKATTARRFRPGPMPPPVVVDVVVVVVVVLVLEVLLDVMGTPAQLSESGRRSVRNISTSGKAKAEVDLHYLYMA